jgi:hypothetical protein
VRWHTLIATRAHHASRLIPLRLVQFFARPAEIFLVADVWKWGNILFISSLFLWYVQSQGQHAHSSAPRMLMTRVLACALVAGAW